MDFIHITLRSSMGMMVSCRDKRERTIFYGGSHRVYILGEGNVHIVLRDSAARPGETLP